MPGHQGPFDSVAVAFVRDLKQASDPLCGKEIQLAEIKDQRTVAAEATTHVVDQVIDVGRIQLTGSPDDSGIAVHVDVQADASISEVVELARLPHRGRFCVVYNSH